MQQAQTRSAAERDALLRESDEYCARAETCFEPERLPGALRGQQAELKRLLGSDEAAQRLKEEAAHIGRRTTLDYYLAAVEEAQQGRNVAALKLLDEGLQHDATDFSLHFLKGVCFGRLDRHVEALGANDTCIALQSESPFPYFNRGLVRLKQKRYDKAKADFDAALRFASDSEQFLADVHVNRALALQGQERYAEVLADLNQALEIGLPRSRLHFVRQHLYEKLGDKEAAQAAHEEGLQAEPHDELDWKRARSGPAAWRSERGPRRFRQGTGTQSVLLPSAAK